MTVIREIVFVIVIHQIREQFLSKIRLHANRLVYVLKYLSTWRTRREIQSLRDWFHILHIYTWPKQVQLTVNRFIPRDGVFLRFLAKFGQNCIFVVSHTNMLVGQMSCNEGSSWFIAYIRMHSIGSSVTILEDRVWITGTNGYVIESRGSLCKL